MSIATLVLGQSGTGKSASLRNLDPADTLLIQAVKKPLPFRASTWSYFNKDTNHSGNIFVTDQSAQIVKLMKGTKRSVIVLDDFQYILANEFMRRSEERGFDKFSDIGRHTWDVFDALLKLPDRVQEIRLQCAYTAPDDIAAIVRHWKYDAKRRS